MIKRYPGPRHWLFTIPIGRKKLMKLWDLNQDVIPDEPSLYRKHLVLTFLHENRLPTAGGNLHEFRFRIGTHYL